MNPRKSVDNVSIEILTSRNSLSSSRRASQISLLADTSQENYHPIDDRNWSWTFLRNSFRISDLGGLYDRYVRRLQNAYFNVYLILQTFLSLVYTSIIVYYYCSTKLRIRENTDDAFQYKVAINNSCPNSSSIENDDVDGLAQKLLNLAIPEIFTHCIVAIYCVIVFLFVNNENVFVKRPWLQIALSFLTVGVIIGTDFGLSFYLHSECGRMKTGQAFPTLIVIYFFLPLPKKVQAWILGGIVSFAYIFFSWFSFVNAGSKRPEIAKRVCADFIYYLCANVVGTYSQILTEVTVRRAFMDRRGFIKSTLKKTYEKEQEEHLLSSILPSHISAKVKTELLNAIQHIGDPGPASHGTHHSHHHHQNHNHIHHHNGHGAMHKKPFSDLFVERHNNVTILYADIVNFTPLTVKLKADELVDTLNELFGRFDEAATNHECLRIKLLGDCYYCVSGLPNPTSNHAKNCVQLGMEMIEIIKDVREKLKVDVAMRIGIHTGNILSGLLGIYKWQYDIWSKDVSIANHMEQAGKPGRIHITKQTKDILGDEYSYKRAFGRLRDKYLDENNIETYLIVPKRENAECDNEDADNEAEEENGMSNKSIFNRTVSSHPNNAHIVTLAHRRQSAFTTSGKSKKSIRSDRRNISTFGSDVITFRKMMTEVNKQMEKAIDDMPLRKKDQWCRRGSQNHNIHPLTMSFGSVSGEAQFNSQPDPLFKFYLGCSIFVLICIGLIKTIIHCVDADCTSDNWILWLAFGASLSILLALVPFVWINYVWSRIKDPHREMDEIPQPENKLINIFFKCSNAVTNNWWIRMGLYISISLVVATFAIIDIKECSSNTNEAICGCQYPWYFWYLNAFFHNKERKYLTMILQYFTFTCSLAILVIYAFFRVHFLIKLTVSAICLAVYGVIIWSESSYVFEIEENLTPFLEAVNAYSESHMIYLFHIALLLHVMDRQMEYIDRLDFIWKRKLTEEHREASLTHAINKILIENILPMQIAKIYLDPNRVGERYSRNYQNVSVMFASIPNFMDFYTENDLNEHGMKCLQLLNEIIVEFDHVLFNHKDVEKIKVIGSTYMAACGLEVNETGRLSATSMSFNDADFIHYRRDQDHEMTNAAVNLIKRRKSLATLCSFAAEMMVQLRAINKDAFQDFQLRVGLATGPVVAGVIGAQKPLYDIWGDTVNLASRMDSTGVAGKIQVSQECAKLLMQSGIMCECRGNINVKGKGFVITYFVQLDEQFRLQRDDESAYATDL